MTRHLIHAVFVLALASVPACAHDTAEPTRALSGSALTLEDGLFYVTADEPARALVVDVSREEPDAHTLPLPEGTASSFARPGSGGREVVVLTGGRDARNAKSERAAVPSYVLLFARTGERARIALGGRYGQLALSADGRFAIAYAATGSLSLQNAIEVVDFDKALAGQAAVTRVDLSLDGRAPSTFVFAPAGFAQRLVLAPLPNALQVLDLEHPERRAIGITLSESRTLTPEQILFADDHVFVRSAGDARILSLEHVPTPRGEHSFQLAPSLLTASGPVSDIAVSGSGTGLRLLAVSGGLDVLDPTIGDRTSVEQAGGFSKVHPFEGVTPLDSQVAPRALLYREGRAQVGFVELGRDATWAARNVEIVELGEAPTSLVPLATRKLALATHASGKLSVIDLEQRTVRVVLLDGAIASLLLDENVASPRVFFATQAGSLARVVLDGLVSTAIPLSLRARTSSDPSGLLRDSLRLVPGATRTRLAVQEESESGRVTLIDADMPTLDSALELSGLSLSGLFD